MACKIGNNDWQRLKRWENNIFKRFIMRTSGSKSRYFAWAIVKVSKANYSKTFPCSLTQSIQVVRWMWCVSPCHDFPLLRLSGTSRKPSSVREGLVVKVLCTHILTASKCGPKTAFTNLPGPNWKDLQRPISPAVLIDWTTHVFPYSRAQNHSYIFILLWCINASWNAPTWYILKLFAMHQVRRTNYLC